MFLAVYLSAFSNNQWEDAISQINEKSLPLVNIDVDVSSLTKANYINDKMYFASTIEEYNAYEKIYRVMLITEESNNNFKLSTGETATNQI